MSKKRINKGKNEDFQETSKNAKKDEKIDKNVENNEDDSKYKNLKGAHWTFIVYPDSAPKNWRDILASTGCEFAISPLHDKDLVEDASGELKKPHWHVIVTYPNSTTYNTIKNMVDKVNSPIPKLLNSPKGMWRYFTHMDYPEKYQYSVEDITYLNGFDIDNVNKLSKTQIYKIKKDLIEFIKDKDIRYYIEFLEKLIYEKEDWLNVALDNTLLFNAVIKSYSERKNDETRKEIIDSYDNDVTLKKFERR